MSNVFLGFEERIAKGKGKETAGIVEVTRRVGCLELPLQYRSISHVGQRNMLVMVLEGRMNLSRSILPYLPSATLITEVHTYPTARLWLRTFEPHKKS